MKVIVAGSLTFNDYPLLRSKLDKILSRQKEVQIVCGEAKGADALGRHYAEEKGYEVLSYPADWDKYGKSAGFKRNLQMAEVADSLVAFWDGKSKGTKHMVDTMQAMNKPVRIVIYGE